MYIQTLDSNSSLASWFSVPCEKGVGVCEVEVRKLRGRAMSVRAMVGAKTRQVAERTALLKC